MDDVTLRVTLSTKMLNRKFDKTLEAFKWYKLREEHCEPVLAVYRDTYVVPRWIYERDLENCVLKLCFTDGSRKVFDPGMFEVRWK